MCVYHRLILQYSLDVLYLCVDCKTLIQSYQTTVQVRTFRSGVDELPEGEELEYDPTAYHMYHSLRLVS
jgi:hypothetical protein